MPNIWKQQVTPRKTQEGDWRRNSDGNRKGLMSAALQEASISLFLKRVSWDLVILDFYCSDTLFGGKVVEK